MLSYLQPLICSLYALKDIVHLSGGCKAPYYYSNFLPLENKENRILQDNTEALVSQASSIKLVEFSAELFNSEVISLEVKDTFAAMGNTVDHQLRLRYLLVQVCESVKHNAEVFHHFLQVLTLHGGRVEEVAKHILEEWRVSEKGAKGKAEFDGACSSQEGGDDLMEEDVIYLMKILSGVTNIWEELGIALGLSKALLEDCSRGGNNKLRLHNLLCMWVKGKYQVALPATLKNLKQELASELVGATDVALNLEQKFWEAKRAVLTIGVGWAPGLATALSIIDQSHNTQVADGTSTLLEVQVSDSEAVSYQWMKDGQSLSDNLVYSGTHTAKLSINPASQGTVGKYTCHITKGSEKVISKEVVLISPEKKHLIKLYSKDTDVPEDSWPPKVTSTFISLALIKKSKGVTDDYKYSVRGDVDDILETKVKVEFEEVFGEYKSGALVLVEGRPGCGKTTLVHKVTRDWATGEVVLKDASLVFLITLRSLANRKSEKLSDLLGLLYLNTQKCEKLVSDIENSNGEGVCFILDGLDEFRPQDETKSVIHQLLYSKYLPEAMIIVASRPVATGELRSKAHVTGRIEVLGFSHQQILEYIDKYPFTSKSETSPSQLKAYLNSHHNLLHMCFLPVHVAMICFLYEHEDGIIPPTETKIYEHFTRFIVLRKLRRSNEDAHLSSIEDLCGDDREYFDSLCHLAFDMTIRSTQTVHQGETKVPLSLGTGPNDAPSLGLITIDRTAGLDGLDNTYAFLHLTFQEYLTAFYIANLKEEEQMEMITLHPGKNHMRVVWKFFSGMVKFENNVAQIEHIIKSSGLKSGNANLYAVQCAYESQQHVVCDSIVKGSMGKLSYDICILSLADMTAIGYVISTTSHPVTELSMVRSHLHVDHVRTLLRNISNNKLKCIKNLDLHGNNIGSEGVVALADGLKSCNNLQILNLYSNNIGVEGAVALADGLKSCNNLHKLYLSDNSIGDEGLEVLADGLKSYNNLEELDLSGNYIGAVGSVALADGLKSCINLQVLHLSDNYISAEGAVALADGLKSCNNLQSLLLMENKIGDEGAVALADGLKSCNNLQTLELSDNNVSNEGAVALADGLMSCSSIHELYLSNNSIGDEGGVALADALKYCNNLQVLGLTDNDIGDEGAIALAVGLKSSNKLQTLRIYNNSIGAEGTASLRAHLKCHDLWLKLI